MKIGIIGLGLIGTSLALAFKEKNFYIWGVDIDKSAIDELIGRGIIDKGAIELEKLSEEIKKSEVIFISVFPSEVVEVIEKLKSLLNENQILTDTASVKRNIINYVEKDEFLKKIFIGGHPLAGKEKSGYKEAESTLFQNKIYFLTPASKVSQQKIEKFSNLISFISARPYIISPEEHDKILSFTSHLPQIISYILSLTVLSNFPEFVGSGFKDTTRLSKSPSKLWIDIIKENKKNVLDSLKEFRRIFEVCYKDIQKGEWEELEKIFENSRNKRLIIEVSDEKSNC
ncbi:MAG: prephenate dehydrogenase [Dictyoglomaceae bacterium]